MWCPEPSRVALGGRTELGVQGSHVQASELNPYFPLFFCALWWISELWYVFLLI